MQTSNFLKSTCSKCRFFTPEGHLHGSCKQLHVTVDSDWSTCSLGAPAFLPIDELLVQLELDLRRSDSPATSYASRGYASTSH